MACEAHVLRNPHADQRLIPSPRSASRTLELNLGVGGFRAETERTFWIERQVEDPETWKLGEVLVAG